MTVTFRRKDSDGDILDTGVLGDVGSISPVANGELLSQAVLRRPTDNLRTRTEELSRAVTSLEYLVQSAVNSSVLLRYLDSASTVARPCVLKLYSKNFDGAKYYYIAPDLPPEDPDGSNPSIVIIGSSTKTYNYVLNRAALEAFFASGLEPTDNRVDGHNKYFGLSEVGDTLCLRVPLVDSSYTSENLLPKTTSLARPAGQATLGNTLSQSLDPNNDFALTIDDAKNSLLKLSSKNSVILTVADTTSALYAFLDDQAARVNEDKSTEGNSVSLEIKDQGGIYGYMPLDLNGLVKLTGETFRLPRAGYWDFEGLVDTTSGFTLKINDDEAGPVDLDVALVDFPSDTMLPPNEYLHPIAVHTGDSILIPGLGGVRISDIETRENSEAFMDTAGRVLGETGTAVSIYKTRTRISYKDLSDSTGSLNGLLIPSNADFTDTRDYFRLPIDVTVPEAGIGEELYLSDLRIHMVLDESYSTSSEVVDVQKVRNVLISIGAFDLRDPLLISDLTYPITGDSQVKFSLEKSIPGLTNNPDTVHPSALPNIILDNFNLKDNMQDDSIAVVELTDNIVSSSLLNKTILVWIYREDPAEAFFTPNDRGSFRIDLHFTWSTRLADNVNLASEGTLSLLE